MCVYHKLPYKVLFHNETSSRPPLIVPFGDPITTPDQEHPMLRGPLTTITSLSLSSIRLI